MKVNWKLHEEICTQDCSSLSELSQCEDSCKASFHASVGEIFLPITWADLREPEAERMFISRRLHSLGENSLVEDLITIGCQICGAPVNDRLGYVQAFERLIRSSRAFIILISFVLAGQTRSITPFLYIAKEAQTVSI